MRCSDKSVTHFLTQSVLLHIKQARNYASSARNTSHAEDYRRELVQEHVDALIQRMNGPDGNRFFQMSQAEQEAYIKRNIPSHVYNAILQKPKASKKSSKSKLKSKQVPFCFSFRIFSRE